MSVVIAYKILEAPTAALLETAVKEALGKGWQPIGGIAIANGIFYQAVAGH